MVNHYVQSYELLIELYLIEWKAYELRKGYDITVIPCKALPSFPAQQIYLLHTAPYWVRRHNQLLKLMKL